ncbi:uncharacterized protein LAESUDRAFT_651210, partial [Laetiporus sulphureus 93-53]
YIHYSAAATYYAPSDPSGIGGMHREHIRVTPRWQGSTGRFDCVLVKHDPTDITGMLLKFRIARVLIFISFKTGGTKYSCALVRWYKQCGDSADANTGM